MLLARASRGAAVSHAVTPDHSEQFSGAGPRNSFFFGGSKLLLPGARPGSKTNFLVAKLDVHFLRNENILILYIVFPQQSCRGLLRLCS